MQGFADIANVNDGVVLMIVGLRPGWNQGSAWSAW